MTNLVDSHAPVYTSLVCFRSNTVSSAEVEAQVQAVTTPRLHLRYLAVEGPLRLRNPHIKELVVNGVACTDLDLTGLPQLERLECTIVADRLLGHPNLRYLDLDLNTSLWVGYCPKLKHAEVMGPETCELEWEREPTHVTYTPLYDSDSE